MNAILHYAINTNVNLFSEIDFQLVSPNSYFIEHHFVSVVKKDFVMYPWVIYFPFAITILEAPRQIYVPLSYAWIPWKFNYLLLVCLKLELPLNLYMYDLGGYNLLESHNSVNKPYGGRTISLKMVYLINLTMI